MININIIINIIIILRASPRAAGPLVLRGRKRDSIAFVVSVAAAAVAAAAVVVVVAVVEHIIILIINIVEPPYSSSSILSNSLARILVSRKPHFHTIK